MGSESISVSNCPRVSFIGQVQVNRGGGAMQTNSLLAPVTAAGGGCVAASGMFPACRLALGLCSAQQGPPTPYAPLG